MLPSASRKRVVRFRARPATDPGMLAAIVAILRTQRVRTIYETHFREPRRERMFLSSIGFVRDRGRCALANLGDSQ
jgi:hypothetical protein